jgi:hypothetical protein
MNQLLIDAYHYHRQRAVKAPTALARAKEDVATGKRRYPHSCDPARVYGGSWQRLEDVPRYGGSRAYYSDDWPDGWRNLGNVGEIRSDPYRGQPVDHNGWYTDDDCQDETIAGYVLQLPARKGKPVYVPGTAHSGCDGVTLYPLDQYDDIAECARAADRYAEIEAEHERDYNRAWRAGQEAGDLNREARELRQEILQICSDLRVARLQVQDDVKLTDGFAVGRLCAIARGKVQSLLEDMYKAREERDELRSDYGREAAFAEGYDE